MESDAMSRPNCLVPDLPVWALDNPYLQALKPRFFARPAEGVWGEIPKRVQRLFVEVERRYTSTDRAEALGETLRALVHDGAFFPNSPAMMNSEQESRVNLFACHVLSPPIETGGFEVARTIHDGCGGIGYDLTALEDPVSLTEVIERETTALNPGRKRKAHSAVTVDALHPRCDAFIELAGRLSVTHTNVELTDAFFALLAAGDDEAVRRWGTICDSIAATGTPSIAFAGQKAARSPNGERLVLNLCGETPLRENESSLVGTLNLARFVSSGHFDVARFIRAARIGVRCLDNMHDLQRHASPIVAERCAQGRKIGLGVMGYADALLELGIRYGSEDALAFARTVMGRLSQVAYAESEALARERGSCDPSLQGGDGRPPRRNAALLAIAANGTLGLLANVTGGMEPMFGLYTRQMVEDAEATCQLQPSLARALRAAGFDEDGVVRVAELLAAGMSLGDIDGVPERIRNTAVCAHELAFQAHIRTQATFQAFMDGGISKTINLPRSSTAADVATAVLTARDEGCIGISLYRDGSVVGQPSQALGADQAVGAVTA
ncbi:hypothetical protein E2F49_11550 [Luteimonas terrae]|uniref:Ribonucleotide reductase large subunit C-terminal domain-containing protein n=2 Tax=Luteimonas terrae TaxID=1530191 RepID=A0A4V3ANL4_9GAMM|nr:hypothetical protein E2F49_11550 [Luteimonas terrae]